MNARPEINWDRIYSVDDVIQPDPFPDPDEMTRPGDEVPRLWDHPHWTRVVDRQGNRFLLLGFGSVQGSVILRDRYRRQFHADGNMRLAAA